MIKVTEEWWVKELASFWGDKDHPVTFDTRRAAKIACDRAALPLHQESGETLPPSSDVAGGDDAVKAAVSILQTAVAGNCDRKNRHGYGDCGAEGIIARALAVLRGEATPE